MARRGPHSDMPVGPVRKFLRAMRESVDLRRNQRDAAQSFQELMKELPRGKMLSRAMARVWLESVMPSIRSGKKGDIIRNWEMRPESTLPGPEEFEKLLLIYGLTRDQIAYARRHFIVESSRRNPHLFDWPMRQLFIGEFGPNVLAAFKISDYGSSWKEIEKSRPGGFLPKEIDIRVSGESVSPPKDFVDKAKEVYKANELRRAGGETGWSDNPTLCLGAIVETTLPGAQERRAITLSMKRSRYRYNVVAKRESGAAFRYRTLQEATTPLQPVDYLASGVGISMAVIFNGGKSMLFAQRSASETFRKGEFDVPVVEGMHPDMDVANDKIDAYAFAARALREELGVAAWNARQRLKIFEIGCDLEFYQWNLLAFAEISFSYSEIYESWQRANDYREHRDLIELPCDRAEVVKFVTTNPFWSAGAACAIKTFDHM